MRLLVVNWRDYRHPFAGGAEVHIHNIITRLSEKYGHKILYVCNRCGKKLSERETYDGIDFLRFGNEYNFNFIFTKRIKSIVREFKPDLIVEDVNKVPFYSPLYLKIPVLLIVPHLFSRAIFRETNPLFASYIYVLEKLMRPVYRNCHLHVISNSTKEDLVGMGYRREDISVAECGIDHQEYFPDGKKASIPIICYTGRIKKYKSIEHLIKAAPRILETAPNAKFIIIGGGERLDALKRLTKRMGLEKSVDFPGFIPHKDKVELLRSAYCLVYPSIKEGWGISNIEANACGTAVVAADVPGLRDSVNPNSSGLLYEYGNMEELAQSVISIITDNQLRSRLEKGALEWAKRFTWDNTAEKFNDVLRIRFGNIYYQEQN